MTLPVFLLFSSIYFAYSDTTSPETDFTAASFVAKYKDIMPQDTNQVLILIEVEGEPESIESAKRAKEIRYLQTYVLKFLSFASGINVVSNQEQNLITAQIHPVWVTILENRSDVNSVVILDALSPKIQQSLGITMENLTCVEDRVPIVKYNGMFACVKNITAKKLIERNWGFFS